MNRAEDLVPLKPQVFSVLLALLRQDNHGYAIMREVTDSTGRQVLPGSFYRDLEGMEALEMIEEVSGGPRIAGRRRSFRITAFGRAVAEAETARLRRLAEAGTELLQGSRVGR